MSNDPLTMSDDQCEHEWPYWTGDPCPYCEIEQLRAAILDHKAETISYCGDNHEDYAPWDLELWAAAPTEEDKT